jgi:mannose-6-phosphate isomerase-like protein (cupin superfamily)
MNEIDELVVKVNPLFLGRGIPLSAGREGPLPLELLEHRTFEGGVAIHRYRLNGTASCAPGPPLGPDAARRPLILPPGGGRHYPMGPIESLFKADEEETGARFSVSEWWLEPGSEGPGAHAHEANEEIFYVVEGVAWFQVNDAWVEAPRGSCLVLPAGTVHDFQNRGDARAGIRNVFIPGGFERHMPPFVEWFRTYR